MKTKRILAAAMSLCVMAQGLCGLPLPAVSAAAGMDFAAFSEAVQQMVQRDREADLFREIVYDADAGLLTRDGGEATSECGALCVQNGELMLRTGRTAAGYALQSTAAYTPFSDCAEERGYTVSERDGQQVITNDFQTARLIVKAEGSIETFGAVRVTEGWNDLHILQYTDSAAAYAAYRQYAQDERVIYVQPSRRVYLDAEETAQSGYNTWGADLIGTETFITDHLDMELLPEVIVAVIDTGINDAHALFDGRLLDGGINVSDSGDDTVNDDLGHGTHCTGTICELTTDNVKILPVKVFDDEGSASEEQIYLGMMYALEQGADVLSMSFGGLGVSPLEVEAMAIADEHGIICCAAAGNSGDDAGYYYPGGIASCITVGAVNANLQRAEFSNNGKMVDVVAPGVDILSTWVGEDEPLEYKSGTSMATPHVSACCALLRSYDKTISPSRAEALLRLNAVDLGPEGFDPDFAWGLVNMADFRWDEGICSAPEFSKKPANYGRAQTVELTTETPDAKIYYTLDGTMPDTEHGILYTEPLVISETTQVFAMAAREGWVSSAVSEAAYSIGGLDIVDALVVEDGVLLHYRGIRTQLSVPEQVDGQTITAVGADAFSGNHYLERVTLPATVTEIGNGAFSGCAALESVQAPGVTVLGEAVFADDAALLTVTLAERMERVGAGAFSGCEALYAVSVTGVTALPADCFAGCIALESLQLDGVTRFGDNALQGCKELKEILCDWTQVETIGNNAFAGCSAWPGDLLLRSLESLGEAAFLGDTSLRRLSLPERITELPPSLLAGCTSLRLLQLPGITKICDSALATRSVRGDLVTELDYGKITTIGTGAFYGFQIGTGYDIVELSSLETLGFRTFSGAAAGGLSLPRIKEVPECAFADARIGVVCLEQAVSIGAQALTGTSAVVLTKALQTLAPDAFPPEYWVVTLDDIPALEQMEDYTLCAEPLVMGANTQSVTLALHEYTALRLLACGIGMTYQWYVVQDDDRTPIAGAEHAWFAPPTDVPGQMSYCCVMTDAGGKTEEVVFAVKVTETDRYEAAVLPDEPVYGSGTASQRYQLTVPESGSWQLRAEGAVPVTGRLCAADGRLLTVLSSSLTDAVAAEARLTAGETYYLTVAARWAGMYQLTLTCRPAAEKQLSDCSIAVAVPERPAYGSDIQPAVTVTAADGTVLRAEKDYMLQITKRNQYYDVAVFGIGDYSGYVLQTVAVYASIPADTPIPVSLASSVDKAVFLFIPRVSGSYYYTATVAEGYAEEQMRYYKNGSYSGGSRYVTIRTSATVADTPDGKGTVYSENDYSPVTGTYFSGRVDLKAGQRYYIICSAESAAEYNLVVSQERRDLRPAEITGTLSGMYEEGETYVPTVYVRLNGELLTEHVDYQLVHMDNDVPGKATVIVVGMGLYIGKVERQYTMIYEDHADMTNTVGMDEPLQIVSSSDRRLETIWFTADTGATGNQTVRYRILNKKLSGGKMQYRLYRYTEMSRSYALILPLENDDYMLKNGTYCLVCYRQFSGQSATAEFTVLRPHSLADAAVTVGNAPYTGSEAAVPLTVRAKDGTELQEGIDYTISYPDKNIMFGETRYVLRQTDHSYGQSNGTFDIYVDLPEDAPVITTGEHTAQVTMDDRLAIYRVTAETDTDFILGSTDVPNIVLRAFTPDAEMIAQAFGSGTKSISFTVPAGETRFIMVKFNGTAREGSIRFLLDTEKRLLSECEVVTRPQSWTGERVMPDVQFYDGDDLLEEGKDYALRYTADDVNIGTASANYIGLGGYFGLCDVTYHIVADDLHDLDGFEMLPVTLGRSYAAEGDEKTPFLIYRYTAGTESALRAAIFNSFCSLTMQRYDSDGHYQDSIFVKPSGEMEFTLGAGETCYFLFTATNISGWNQTFNFLLTDRGSKNYTQVKDPEHGVTYRVNPETGYAEVYAVDVTCEVITLLEQLEDGTPVSFVTEGVFAGLPTETVVYGYPGCIAAEYADSLLFAYIESGNAEVPGDLNGDGRCSAADAVLLTHLLCESGTLALTAQQLQAADVDGNGMLELADYMALLACIQS